MVSDAIRDENGRFKVSSFIPAGESQSMASDFNEELSVIYVDDEADLPLPIKIRQDIYSSAQNFAIIRFDVANPTPEPLNHLAIGFFCDFDIERNSDQIGFDSLMGMYYQYNSALGLYIGMAGVSANEFSFTAATNPTDGKKGFTKSEKYQMADASGINIEENGAADWHCTISRSADNIGAFGRVKMAVVVAAAGSLPELRELVQTGMDEYGLFLDIDEDWLALPEKLELEQNYPNPFNPRTTIRFSLNSAQRVTLNVYNVTGQVVCTLMDDQVQAGQHSVVWDGQNYRGESVASGIYFYRLTAGNETRSKKMMLLK
jgi:hypothetical protein